MKTTNDEGDLCCLQPWYFRLGLKRFKPPAADRLNTRQGKITLVELILCIGIPATGKSTFCRERFYDTHVRLNLDMLRTRRRERLLLLACLAARQRVVVDNTNVTRLERATYIVTAKTAGFCVTGYFFRSRVAEALGRNSLRAGRARVPDTVVHGMSGRLELPSLVEGFDRLYFVRMLDGNGFDVHDWQIDPP